MGRKEGKGGGRGLKILQEERKEGKKTRKKADKQYDRRVIGQAKREGRR